MLGVGSNVGDEWFKPLAIAATDLPAWIDRSLKDGKFEPGKSDLYVYNTQQSIKMCHEADIHLETSSVSKIEGCSRRWFEKSFRILRSDLVPPRSDTWREIKTVEQAISGL